MLGRKLIQTTIALAFALILSGCIFSVQDGDGNVYVIATDGTLDMTGENLDTLDSLIFKSFVVWADFATSDARIFCRAGGNFSQIMHFPDRVNNWLPTVDIATHPDTLSEFLQSTCDTQYDLSAGTYTFELAVMYGLRFVPMLSADNMACTMAYMNGGAPVLTAVDWCLQADPRESAIEWGLSESPTPVNILKLVVDEATISPEA